MTTPSNQTPDDFTQIGSDQEVDAALQPKKTLNMPAATAVLAGIVVLAVGLGGGAGLHAAFASGSSSTSTQPAGPGGAGGYGGMRGQGQGQGQAPGGGQGSAAVGTVVSANSSQLVVKTQSGDVTVKLTGDTSIDITSKGTAGDLKAGEQVVVNGATTDGTLTATTVRQGGAQTGGMGRNPNASPSSR